LVKKATNRPDLLTICGGVLVTSLKGDNDDTSLPYLPT
jgi:hypothetical protein